MKKIVIAGGSGFLGSALAKYFAARQAEVIILSRKPSSTKGVTEVYVVKNSPTNTDNFSTDKNMYFEKISKFLAAK